MSNDDLAMFVIRMLFIIKNESQRIAEDSGGLIKTDIVFLEIGYSLLLIPLNPHNSDYTRSRCIGKYQFSPPKLHLVHHECITLVI